MGRCAWRGGVPCRACVQRTTQPDSQTPADFSSYEPEAWRDNAEGWASCLVPGNWYGGPRKPYTHLGLDLSALGAISHPRFGWAANNSFPQDHTF